MSPGDNSVKLSGYPDGHEPSLLQPIERAGARAHLGVPGDLPFHGEDLWRGYEFSWLNPAGKPRVAGLRLRVPCTSPNLVESKSMKLYLNGFAQTRFAAPRDVAAALENELAAAFGAPLAVEVANIEGLGSIARLPGDSLDDLDVAVDAYGRDPELLKRAGGRVTATWHTDLFRSLCPITGQPDWASVMVGYTGPAIEPEGLLRYLVSFRSHAAFHEDTVERIFVDIMARCRPEALTVYGCFLRRGGLDINPFRSTTAGGAPELRLPRQ